MNKCLFFGDIHIHPHKRSSERLQDCLDCLDWVFQTAKENKVQNIVFLGDLFHDRQKIDVLTYQRTFEIFERHLRHANFQVYLLLGNHDLWHFQKCDVSSVNPLRAIDGIEVVDSPKILLLNDVPIAFLPFTHSPIEGAKELQTEWEQLVLPKGTRRILTSHIAIDGALYNARHQTFSEVIIEHDSDMVKVGSELFDWWDNVFLGHYHAAQRLDDRVEYIGSPLQLSFGESDQQKHVLIYDLENGQREYVTNDFSPKHYILTEQDVDNHDLKDQFVRISVEDMSATSVVEMQQNLSSLGVKSIQIQQKPKQEEHVITDAKEILYRSEEMLEQYLDAVELNDLDKNKLLEIGKMICEKGQE